MTQPLSELHQGEPAARASSMRSRVFVALALAGAVVVVVSLVGGPRSDPGTVFERREFALRGFTVGVTAAHEDLHWGPVPLPNVVPGGHYRFQASSGDGSVEVMTFRHDDPGPIPDGCVVQVSPRVAFVFMGWRYAVTTDGGGSWDAWDAALDLPGYRAREHANYGFIQGVTLDEDGTGTMHIDPIRWPPEETLVTRDFGRTWQRPPGVSGGE
jgi:hypothetical protein